MQTKITSRIKPLALAVFTISAPISAGFSPFLTTTSMAMPMPMEEASNWQVNVINKASETLAEKYVYEEVGHKIAAFLNKQTSKFIGIEDKTAFASDVTKALEEEFNDKHLRLIYRPTSNDAAKNALNNRRKRDPKRAAQMAYCRSTKVEAQIMDGNIGYFPVPSFPMRKEALAAFDAAMKAVENTDGLILDLRKNCGGSPESIKHLSSYFFNQPTLLTATETRGEEPGERWTHDNIPGQRYLDKPLTILTDGGTFSAGESFTFGMRTTGRATIVGERTGGGGHFGGLARLSDDFVLFVPVGRTFDPRTGLGWEAEGIKPDVQVSADNALEKALEMMREGRS